MALLSKGERLDEFFRRLAAAEAQRDADGSLVVISSLLTAVEDEHSGVPDMPALWLKDGRLYPPQPDSLRRSSPVPGTRCYRTVTHRVLLGENGAIAILDGDDVWVFQKPGSDGKGIQ